MKYLNVALFTVFIVVSAFIGFTAGIRYEAIKMEKIQTQSKKEEQELWKYIKQFDVGFINGDLRAVIALAEINNKPNVYIDAGLANAEQEWDKIMREVLLNWGYNMRRSKDRQIRDLMNEAEVQADRLYETMCVFHYLKGKDKYISKLSYRYDYNDNIKIILEDEAKIDYMKDVARYKKLLLQFN